MNSNIGSNKDYIEKYLKYKTKYIELKKKFLDSNNTNKTNRTNNNNNIKETDDPDHISDINKLNMNINKLKGGTYFYEQNDLIKKINLIDPNKKIKKNLFQFSSVYFKTNLTNSDIIKKYSKIRKTILKNDSLPAFNYHLTLLILEINLDYPKISNSLSYFDKNIGKKKLRKTLSFLDPEEIKNNFENIFKNVVLNSLGFEVVGKLKRLKLDGNKEITIGVKNEEINDCMKYPGWYFVDRFDVNNKNLITTFRMKIYEKLNEFMKFEYMKLGGKTKDYVGYRVETEIDSDYILLFFDNFSKDIPLMAIKKFYYGKNTWMPHITIFNTDELATNNMKFLQKYIINFLTNKNKELSDQLIFSELKKSSVVKEFLKKNNKTKITNDDMQFELQL